jgi:cation:H+ antiporter
MLSSLFFLTIGSAGLYFGSEWLIDGAKDLAKKLKVSDLVIGLTIVSIGTSFPELVVGLISAFQGYTEFVIGNVLGSNIANIGLAIGLPALFFKIDFDLKNSIAPFIYNLLACLMLYIFLQDNLISSKEAQGLILVFFVYIIASFLRPNITSCDGELENENISPIYVSLLRIFTGSIMLYYGSVLFVDNGAIPLVEQFGFSEKAIGMTIVAIGTSLPELFVTLMALSKKEVGISLGNIIGSNIFNILFVLATIALVTPIKTSNVNFELLLGVGFLLSLMFFIYLQKGLNKITASILFIGYITFLFLQFYG